ncbi:MAG: hypothetical protein ACHQNT_03265 [Bacteroidia bacterium]
MLTGINLKRRVQAGRIIRLLFSLVFLFAVKDNIYAAVTVVPVNNGNNMNIAPGSFTTLSTIHISENNKDDYASPQAGAVIVLSAPLGFEFNPGVGSVSYSPSKNITTASIVVSSASILITISVSGTNKFDDLYISNIQSRATTAGTSGSILWVAGGSAVITGDAPGGGINHGNLSTSPLPVELANFSAACKNNFVRLVWQTASEINNDYFSIWRAADAINFSVIGKIKGAGNSTSIKNYEWIDEQPINGKSYYRLQQTDFDGQMEFSEVISSVTCNFRGRNKLIIQSAGLFSNSILLNLTTSFSGNHFIRVFDTNGKQVFSEILYLNEGKSEIKIRYPFPTGGLYYISIINSEASANKIFAGAK